MSTKNYKHVDITCPECERTNVVYDPTKAETFCNHCGLVIQEAVPVIERRLLSHEHPFINLFIKEDYIKIKEADAFETKGNDTTIKPRQSLLYNF